MTFPVLWMYARGAPPSDIIVEVLEEWKLDGAEKMGRSRRPCLSRRKVRFNALN